MQFVALRSRCQARTVRALRQRPQRQGHGTGARVLRHSRDLLVVVSRRGWEGLDRASSASASWRLARAASRGRRQEEVFFSLRFGSPHSLARRFAPSLTALGCSASRLRRLALLRSSRLGHRKVPRAFGRQGLSQVPHRAVGSEPHRFRSAHGRKARPNTSVNARPSGVPPSPAPGFVYPPSAGLGATPPVPRYLER